ncbi:PIG-L family deacetylase [Pseudogracilibacillus auburnensis]|uniref:GlcNAc-PI de-N-acetylase n=1 Tax=Pseudogracilibacillus auburnensis TaxID=1494959 RepID=A0A2V3VYP3_9BACI|nr:PIG-L family deacetylase [Pseudogracilibacillus auburnensis]PXW85868.1 GlcNAc-PI de-N-acetylase [Pseudogracilibacillus auburnensis]
MFKRKTIIHRKLMFILILGIIILETSLNNYVVKAEEDQKTAIFLVPHQDDELLTFGVAILDHLWNNYDVHLVLMTDGGASAANKVICDKLGFELTIEQFVEARNNEFIRSAQILGVDQDNIHFIEYKDGEITTDDVKNTILTFQEQYPNASFKATSYLDKNSSHAAVGEGLQQMYDEGKVKDARFYMTFYQFGYEPIPETGYDNYHPHFQPLIEASADVYNRWQPEFAWYAIGGHSVPMLLEKVKENPISRWHMPGFER